LDPRQHFFGVKWLVDVVNAARQMFVSADFYGIAFFLKDKSQTFVLD
jgi:hypothetical protein